MKLLTIPLLSLAYFLSGTLSAQINDCTGAEVVCGNDDIAFNPQGPGLNDFADPDNNPGCMVALEQHSAWYYFEIDDLAPPDLVLGFIISPNGGFGEDYDWALYGPDVDCDNLGSPIRCSSSSAQCDFCPETGMGMGAMDTTEGPGTGDGFVMTLVVQPGQGFYLLIDNWLGTQNGFELTWTDTAADWLDCDATPPCGLNATAGNDLNVCENSAPFNLNGGSTGNNGNESYSWSGTNGGTGYLNNPNLEDPTVTLPPGFSGTITYTLTVTEDACIGEDEMVLTVNPLPAVSISQIGPFCQNDPPIALTGSPPGGTWSGEVNGNNFDPTISGPGIHTVNYTFTDGNNCTNSTSIQIEVYANPSVAINPDPAEFCQSEGVLLLTGSGSGGAGGYEFEWTTPSETATGDIYAASLPGDYTLTVSDANGCSNSTTTTVTIHPNPIVQIVNPGPICENVDIMTIAAVPAGGTFSGSIISPEGDIYPNMTSPGTYTINYNYFDINNCEGTDETEITIFSTPNAIAANNGPICEGEQILLFGDTDAAGSNISYSWAGPSGYSSNAQNPTNATMGGVYVLQVTVDGCPSEFEATNVVVAEMPIAIALNDGPYCEGQSIQLFGNTDIPGTTISYQWSGPNGYSSTEQNPNDAALDGTYSLIVTVDGCASDAATTEVIFSAPPDAEAGNNGPLCEGDAIQLFGNTNTPGSTINYNWTGPNGYQSSEQNPVDATEPGVYELMVEVDGCNSQTETTEVLVNSLPQPIISGNPTFCTGNSTTLDAGSGYSAYLWDDTSNNQTLEVFASGTYIVTVTDGNGCTGTASIDVTENASLMPDISGTLEFCDGNNTILDAGAGFSSYTWSTNEMNQSIDVTTGGNYSVTVSDDDGCTGSANVTVTVNANPIVTIGGSTSFCTGGSSVLDAGAGYASYAWSNDSTSQTITVSVPGDYTVEVIDQNGCEGDASVSVEESTSLNPVITGGNAFCENGSLTLNAGSGFATYLWSDNSNTQNLTVSVAGNYSVTVSDNQNCTGEASVSVAEIQPPAAQVLTEAELCNTEAGGSIINLYDLVLSGDMNGSWEDADNSGASGTFDNLNFNNIPAGDYIFVYTTNSAVAPCPETEYEVIVTIVDCTCPDVLFFDADPLCNADGTLDLSSIENTLESGIWTIIQTPTGSNPAVLNGSVLDATDGDPGDYVLQFELLDQPPPGCPIVFQTHVTVDPVVSAGVAAAPLAFCFDENETISLSDLLSGADANGAWTETSVIPSQGGAFDPASGTFVTNGQIPGNYSFEYTVTSAGVCPDDASEVTVVVNSLPEAMIADVVVLDCNNPIQSLDGSGSDSGLSFDINWSGPGVVQDGNQNTLFPNINQPGNYTLTITNLLTGCSAQATAVVDSDTDLPQASAGNDTAITCNEPVVTLQAGGDTGTGFEILWSGPGINAGNMNDPAPQVDIPGVYILSVTDLSNNCISIPDTVIVTDETADPDIFILSSVSELDCYNPVIGLEGGSSSQNVSFQWLDPDMNVLSVSEVVTGIDQEGTYIFLVTNDLTGCTASASIDVTDNTVFPDVVIANPDQLTCIISEVTLSGAGSSVGPEIEFLWTGPLGGISGANDESNTSASLPGIYTLTVTNTANGCSASAQTTVGQDTELPQVVIVAPETLDCSMQEVTLDGNGSSVGSGISYFWTNASGMVVSSSISFTTDESGVYELTVLNGNNGCSNSVLVEVFENTDLPTGAWLTVREPECFGDRNAMISVDTIIGGTLPYLYSLNDAPFVNNNFFSNLPAGNYNLEIEDANGCRWDTLLTIQEPPPVFVSLGADIELQLGESTEVEAIVNLSPNQIDTLLWSPPGLVQCTDSLCLEGNVLIFSTETLSVEVIDEHGCSATDRLTIFVNKDRRVFIPSAFSPNGDGTNDVFYIFGDESQIARINQFTIFNRWGDVVFEAGNFKPNDPDYGWNGEFKNKRMNPGVFVYFAEIVFIDGHVELYKGDVTLLK